MLRNWTSHQTFQETLISELNYIKNHSHERIKQYADIISKVYLLDLEPAFQILSPFYSSKGRPALYQAEILRSLVVMSHLRIDSITQWVKMLRSDSIFRIICGFPNDYCPGVGNFYDFLHRFWNEPIPNIKALRAPYRKPRKKLKGGEKLPPKHMGVVDTLVERALACRPIKSPEATLQKLLLELAIKPSADLNLLGDPDNLVLAGDGTPLPSGANHRGVKVCDCVSNRVYNCDCHRRFSDPNARWGWDSYRKEWYYGYSCYIFTAADSPNDLPLFFTMAQANRHDSILAAISIPQVVSSLDNMTVTTFLGDSAHDAMSIYRLNMELGINPVIDLNARNKGGSSLLGSIGITQDGVPICLAEHPMVNWGFCKDRMRIKWRCPPACGKLDSCSCQNECSKSSYGRVIYTYPNSNYRLFTPIPRGTQRWKDIFKKRTSVERTNKRTKVDYALQNTKARTKCHMAWRVLLSFVNQHADAWLQTSKATDILDQIRNQISHAA